MTQYFSYFTFVSFLAKINLGGKTIRKETVYDKRWIVSGQSHQKKIAACGRSNKGTEAIIC
jgi:hypothetical protein